MSADGYTVSELMEKTGKTRSAVISFLSNHKIKPISYEARYPLDTLEKLLKAKVGRPAKKQPEPEPPKKAKNQA